MAMFKRIFKFPTGTGRAIDVLVGLLVVANLSACNSTPGKPEAREFKTFSSETYHSATRAPMCKSLLDSYCNYLYSPEASGNLEVRRSTVSTKILQGETPNQLSQVFYRYAKAKLRGQSLLPNDFRRVLARQNYFQKLEEFIGRKPLKKMSLGERLTVEQTNFELSSIWSAAISEAVLLRMSHKYPIYHTLSEKLIPTELSLERMRVRRNLISEISKAIWRDNENWKRVEMTFARLKKSYLNVIGRLDVSDDIKKDWIERIDQVQLVLPGSIPAISNDECSTTTANAYYYSYLNVITVCAGDFNSEDILQTLAHEMGHALDIDRSQYLFERHSELGVQANELRKNVCSPATFSCDKWRAFSEKYDTHLSSLDGYQPQVLEFQKCLKRRPTIKPLGQDDVGRFAASIINDRVSELASSDRFLRITKPDIPMPNGKSQRNPNYLNPCSYYLWSQGEEPVGDELTTLIFFTAAYRCSDQPAPQRLKAAIETAQQMSRKVIEKTLNIEGEFSGRSELESGGFSSPPGERFADVIGSYAMADYLTQLPYQWDRRNKFLAGASWLCLEPSLASHYPEESSIEKAFVFDSHTEGDQRRKELFSTPIREVIGCEKDFQFSECILPMKPTGH